MLQSRNEDLVSYLFDCSLLYKIDSKNIACSPDEIGIIGLSNIDGIPTHLHTGEYPVIESSTYDVCFNIETGIS